MTLFGLIVLIIACALMGYLSVLFLQLRRLGHRRRIMQCRMSGLNGATFKRRPWRKE